jgi:hypothetical protein
MALSKITNLSITDDAVRTVGIKDDNVTTAKILDNNVTLAKLGDGTQGDILYYGASGAPARLGFGTSGDFLKTQGTGANPAWASAGLSKLFLAYPSADITISNDTATTIACNNEAMDTQSGYNTATYRYTIQSGDAGKWLIGYQFYTRAVSSGWMTEVRSFLKCNGADTANKSINTAMIHTGDDATINYNTSSAQVIVDAAESDYFELVGLGANAAAEDISVSGGNTPYQTIFYGIMLG